MSNRRIWLAGLAAMLACGLPLGGCAAWDPPQPRIDEKAALDKYIRSQLRLEAGDVEGALTDLRAATKANPNLSVAYESGADISRKRGELEAAAKWYEGACKANRYAFKPHYNLGVTYQELAEKARAGNRLQQQAEYIRLAVSTYIRAVTIDPDDFDANINLSACYFQMGKYDQAEQYCKAAIRVKDTAEAYCNLGIIYDAQNRLYDAIGAYKDSLERDTKQPAIWINLGSTHARQGTVPGMKAAVYSFQQAAKLSPQDAMPHEQIGMCCFNLGELDNSLAAYRKAAELNPRSPMAWRGIGVVYMAKWLKAQDQTDLRDQGLAAWTRSLELNSRQDDLKRLVDKYTPKVAPPQL
jgi:tetratricopeptide (TPR) repeat protein